MTRLSVTEARASLPELLDRVAQGDEVTITRHGKPAAVLLRPDAVRARRAERTIEQARRLGAMLAEARERPLSPPCLSEQRAAELVAAVRAGRDRS